MTGRRPYRFVIRAYPPQHRRRHGDELIDTALAMTDGRWSARQALSFLGNGLMASLATPRRWWGLAVLFPVVFATGQLVLLLTGDLPTRSIGEGDRLADLVWVAKWLTVPSIPILAVLLTEKVSERPARWRVATGVWLVIGVATVVVIGTRMGALSETISNAASWRLWPTARSESTDRALDALGGFGPRWTLGWVVASELVAVGVVALASGLAVRRCARGAVPPLAAGAVPLAVAVVLLVYRVAAPWSFRADFDFFVGDAVLGATMGELLFFPAPFDPIGSLAIGIAALSMGGQIVAWGGVAAAPERVRVTVPAAVGGGPLPGSVRPS